MALKDLKALSLSFVASLKACAKKKDLCYGSKIHADIQTSGLLHKNTSLGNMLVNMYTKCGAFAKAQQLLNELPVRNVVSWSTLIAGYAQQGLGMEAIDCYKRMRSEGHSPDVITYICILKACGITHNVEKGKQTHDEIVSRGLLGMNVVLGNALVDMYAKCSAVSKAQQVLDEMPVRNVITWSALIAGYAQQRQGKEALDCYERMRIEGHSPDGITYICILQACGIIRDADKGKQIHDEIISKGLLGMNVVLGNALVDMYAKCGAFAKAQHVLVEMPVQNVVTWSALIAGYAQHGQGEKALNCYEQMRRDGHSPDTITYICILKACGITQDADKGKQIHYEIVNQGLLGANVMLGQALIDMYAKCGAVARAQQVLDGLPVRDVVSWCMLIAGYAQQGQGRDALNCYERMQSEGHSPDAISYICILKACGITQDIDKGTQVHNEIVNRALLGTNVGLGNALVDMYAKCGLAAKAQKVLEEMPVRNVITWSALIGGHVQHGQGKEALDCYERMRSEGHSPDAITYICISRACGITRDADKGKQFYDEVLSQGLLGMNVVLGNALVDMYAKCGVVAKAQLVLDGLPVRDVASWNALIAGYMQQGQGEKALDCYDRMRSEDLSPNATTYICILKACGITRDADRGKQIHDEIVSQELLGTNFVLGNALVDMYAKCCAFAKAQQVFNELPNRNSVRWSALILGYAQQGQCKEALDCYDRMQSEGFPTDAITYTCIMKVCGITQDIDRGKKLHAEIVREGLLRTNIVLGNGLVDMYGKCGVVGKAQQVLDEMPIRDVVTWSALIAGYAQQGLGEEALNCYKEMKSEGHSPDAIAYICILRACGITQDADRGKQIHDEIVSQGLLAVNDVLGNALIDMYAKCQALTQAQHVLDKLPVRDVISWSALIAGYAQKGQGEEALSCFHRMRSEGITPNVVSWNALIRGYAQQGLVEEALDCFQEMQHEGISPDAVTFVCVLKACSHSGLVNAGEKYLKEMRKRHGITPDKEHHACMIDLFGRTGHFDKAMILIEQMPSSDHPPVWSALLGACQRWGNVKLGRLAFEHAVRLDEGDSAAYVLMANIYAAAGM